MNNHFVESAVADTDNVEMTPEIEQAVNKIYEEKELNLHLTKKNIKGYSQIFTILDELEFIYELLYSLQIEIQSLKAMNKKDKLAIVQGIDKIVKTLKFISTDLFSKYNRYNLKCATNVHEENLIKSKFMNILNKLYSQGGKYDEK